MEGSSLPVHPLFLTTPMVQYPTHLLPITQSKEDDSSIHPVALDSVSNDNKDKSSDEDDSALLVSDISVGLPSEGSVSVSLIHRLNN